MTLQLRGDLAMTVGVASACAEAQGNAGQVRVGEGLAAFMAAARASMSSSSFDSRCFCASHGPNADCP